MLNLNQLRTFYETARCMSFSVAARHLCVSQPAVTAQVKLFEDHCGFKLFIRKGRNLYLTEEGNLLYDYARKIFEQERQTEEAIERIVNLNYGTLRLGSARTYSRYFLPHLISVFHKSYPHINIHLDEGSSLGLLRNLIDLKNQIVIVAKTEDHPNVCFIPFGQDEVVLIMSPRHRLARKKSLTIHELVKENIIMKEAGSGTRKNIEAIFSQNKINPKVLMETSDAEMIKLLVQYGEGVSFLVRTAVASDIRENKLVAVTLKGYRIFLEVCVAHLTNIHLSPAAMAFLEIVKKLVTREGGVKGLNELIVKMSRVKARPKNNASNP